MGSVRRRILGIAVGGACMLLAAYLLSVAGDERALDRANAAGLRGDYARALAEARTATGSTARARAAMTEAYALAGQGRFRAAASRFAAAARSEPRNWVVRRDWARTLLASGGRRAAQTQMRRALALNPRMRLPPGFAQSRPG